MNWPLRTRLTPPAFDRWFSWAAFALLAVCTTLVLLASAGWALVLVASLAAGWLVLGRLLPRR